MEENMLSPQTPSFGQNIKLNFSELLKMKLENKSKTVSNEKAKNKEKRKNKKSKSKSRNKSKSKKNKQLTEELPLPSLYLDKENRYYELLTKKLILRNDFDRNHAKKFLAEVEEAFLECDLNDEISEEQL